MERTDVDLITATADGNVEAFTELYDRYAPRMLGLIAHVMRTRREADDVLQDAFVKIWRSSADYDPRRAPPVVWLLTVVRSTALDAVRRLARETARSEHVEGGAEPVGGATGVTDDRSRADAALAGLPDEQREVIRLSFYRGLTHTQIADLQQVPLGTVKTRISLGIQKLRETMNRTDTSRMAER